MQLLPCCMENRNQWGKNVKFNLSREGQTSFKKHQLYRSIISNHACRHLTASCRTALFGSSRAFDIARSTWNEQGHMSAIMNLKFNYNWEIVEWKSVQKKKTLVFQVNEKAEIKYRHHILIFHLITWDLMGYILVWGSEDIATRHWIDVSRTTWTQEVIVSQCNTKQK